MNEKNADRYIQFPLCLLQETYKNPYNGLNIILDYGIVKFAKSFEYKLTDVAKQLMYAYYRKERMIQDKLFKTLEGYIDDERITIDTDKQGFDYKTFDPCPADVELLYLFDEDPVFKQAAIFRYQIIQAESFLKINGSDIDIKIQRYNKGQTDKNWFEKTYGDDCCPTIKPLQLIEFRDSGKDLDLIRAYIGIRSIIGQKNFERTHKTVILSRMMGCKSNNALKDFLKSNKTAKEIYDKYSQRYWFESLLMELEKRGFITKIGYKRLGIFVSVKIKDKNTLAKAIIQSKEKYNAKSVEKSAREMIQQHLYNTTNI